MDGKVVMIWPDQSRFEGDLQNGKTEGKGSQAGRKAKTSKLCKKGYADVSFLENSRAGAMAAASVMMKLPDGEPSLFLTARLYLPKKQVSRQVSSPSPSSAALRLMHFLAQ